MTAQSSGATRSADVDLAPDVPRRLLVNGWLVEAEDRFASVNPATGEVIGYAPQATVAVADAAVAAARRAFDDGAWANDVELRLRCLEQFHQALVEHREQLRELTIAEVGYKQSGIGRETGVAGFEEFLERKTYAQVVA